MPLKRVLVRESTAAAEATLSTFFTVLRVAASITVAPRVGSSREVFTWRPVPVSVPAPAPKSNRGPPPAPCWVVALCAVAGWLTVMSVPTPYTDCRTLCCAWRTPPETASTMMTRAIASAIPIAMMIVCLRRLSNSRRR